MAANSDRITSIYTNCLLSKDLCSVKFPVLHLGTARTALFSWAYARLEWADGTRREAWLRTGEGYAFTARVAALAAAQLGDESTAPGAFTPGALFGADFARQAGGEIVIRESRSA